jgi:Glycine-rich domain-containing protein-like
VKYPTSNALNCSPLGTSFVSCAHTRDVAICFHVHCLSPFRFRNDMINHGLWQTGIKFPLEGLYQLIQSEQWSDPDSERIWNQHYPKTPYQLWASDPILGNEPLKFQTVNETPMFSIDLVAASLRQHVFTTRIVQECEGIDHPSALQRAVARYYKFLQLMKRKDKITRKYIPLVPTLDIDLAWHTHQLFPQAYREFCLEVVGRQINHDDTFDETVIGNGLRATSLAWLNAYNEPYTPADLRKAYFTRSRVAFGIVFPPYGIFIFQIGRKLKMAQTGMLTTSLANDSEDNGPMRGNRKCGGHACQSNCSSCGGSGGG